MRWVSWLFTHRIFYDSSSNWITVVAILRISLLLVNSSTGIQPTLYVLYTFKLYPFTNILIISSTELNHHGTLVSSNTTIIPLMNYSSSVIPCYSSLHQPLFHQKVCRKEYPSSIPKQATLFRDHQAICINGYFVTKKEKTSHVPKPLTYFFHLSILYVHVLKYLVL